MTIEANIVVSENPRVLTIPKNFLVGSDSVWIEENSDKKKIKINKKSIHLIIFDTTKWLYH